jgi:hypothetical protein
VTKDELRCIDVVLRVELNRNAITVILHVYDDTLLTTSHGNLNVLDGLLFGILLSTNKSIPSVHKDFIKDLVEPRIESNLAMHHLS